MNSFYLDSLVELGSKQHSGTIEVQTLNDDIPEVDEVFLVNLTSVELIDIFETSMKPSLGMSEVSLAVIYFLFIT